MDRFERCVVLGFAKQTKKSEVRLVSIGAELDLEINVTSLSDLSCTALSMVAVTNNQAFPGMGALVTGALNNLYLFQFR